MHKAAARRKYSSQVAQQVRNKCNAILEQLKAHSCYDPLKEEVKSRMERALADPGKK